MSLYSIATDLFADIDKVRAAGPDPIIPSKTKQSRLVDDGLGGRRHFISEAGLPQVRDRRQNDKTERTSTLELLEGCLHDIHEIRCGARPTPMAETKHSCEGQWCPLDDSDGTSSSSSSETSRTWGEPIHQDINNAEGGTLGPATDGGVCVVANGGRRKAAIDSFVGGPTAKLCASSGGKNARSGPTTATRTSTIPHESGTIDASLGRASPHVLSNDTYSATDKCVETSHCTGTDAAATESYADFEREITEWSISPAGVGGGQRVRTDMAAYLSVKYLCRKLDAMPPSAVVCHLRREVVRRIDLLATGTDPHADGDATKVIASKPHSERNDFVSSGDGNLQVAGHRTDDNVAPLLGNRPEISESLSGRVASYRGPPANRASADFVAVDPTRKTLGRSILAGRQFPGLKGVAPAPSFGDLCTTATKLPGGGPEARGRIGGEAPSSCLKRLARQSPPVHLDKGCESASNPTGGPRARAVRFLLEADGGKSFPPSVGGGIGPPAQVEIAEIEVADPRNVERLWTCVVCGKNNEEGEASCTICGKRQHGRCVAQAHLGGRAEEKDPGVFRGAPKTLHLQQQRPENRQESVHLISSGRQTGIRLGGALGRTGSVRETSRKSGGNYDASSFAKMRRETEPAVRARLGLTGEIKSLLSVIRRNA